MILHLVTDRRRLAPGAGVEAGLACLLEQARAAAAAGVDVIQVRERDLDGRTLTALVRQIVAATRGSRTRVVVNDRLDVSLASGADGVHLRGDSFEAHDVRPCVPPGFLIGRSVHSVAEARESGPVDYLVAGTLWPTPSKPERHPLLGLDGLRAVVTSAAVPVLAIGGVGLDGVASLASTGAAGLAGIGIWMADAGNCRAIPLDDRVRAFHAAGEAANMGTHPQTD